MNFDGKEKIIEQIQELQKRNQQQMLEQQQNLMQGQAENELVPVGHYNGENKESVSNGELIPVGKFGGEN